MDPYKAPQSELAFQKRGAVFQFEIDGHNVVAFGTFVTGKEEVYVDGKLVSDKRTYKKNSKHVVVLNDIEYEIRFFVTAKFIGKLRCQLFKNGKLKEAYLLDVKGNPFVFCLSMFFVLAFSFLLGFIQKKLALPEETGLLVAVAFIAAMFFNSKYVKYTANKDPDFPV